MLPALAPSINLQHLLSYSIMHVWNLPFENMQSCVGGRNKYVTINNLIIDAVLFTRIMTLANSLPLPSLLFCWLLDKSWAVPFLTHYGNAKEMPPTYLALFEQ